MKRTWSVIVIYDEAISRDRAMRVCDHLVERFWADCEFEVSGWSCAMLEWPKNATEATEKAVRADLIIFALQPEASLPILTQQWVESWASQRADREGALVDLITPDEAATDAGAERHIFLRHVAHRAGMDYLTREPQTMSLSIPDSIDSFTARAERVTSTLDEILHVPLTPPSL